MSRIYFSKKELIIFFVTLLTVFFSGILWLIYHYLVKYESEFGITTHPMETKVLILHGIAGYIFLFIFGNIWYFHARELYKRKGYKKNRISGVLTLYSVITLIVTGLSLYYLTNETLRFLSSITHSIVGIAIFIISLYHSRKAIKYTYHIKIFCSNIKNRFFLAFF